MGTATVMQPVDCSQFKVQVAKGSVCVNDALFEGMACATLVATLTTSSLRVFSAASPRPDSLMHDNSTGRSFLFPAYSLQRFASHQIADHTTSLGLHCFLRQTAIAI